MCFGTAHTAKVFTFALFVLVFFGRGEAVISSRADLPTQAGHVTPTNYLVRACVGAHRPPGKGKEPTVYKKTNTYLNIRLYICISLSLSLYIYTYIHICDSCAWIPSKVFRLVQAIATTIVRAIDTFIALVILL